MFLHLPMLLVSEVSHFRLPPAACLQQQAASEAIRSQHSDLQRRLHGSSLYHIPWILKTAHITSPISYLSKSGGAAVYICHTADNAFV